MAADKTLVEGAYRAAKYYGKGDAASARFGDQMSETISDLKKKKDSDKAIQAKEQDVLQQKAKTQEQAAEQQALAEKKAVEQQWSKAANKIVAADGNMSSDNYATCYDYVNGDLKDRYINGSPKEKGMAMNDLNQQSQVIAGIKEYATDNAQLLIGANRVGEAFNEDGYSLALQDEAYANELSTLGGHTSETSISMSDNTNEAGEVIGQRLGMRGSDGGTMTLDEAAEMSDKFLVDVGSKAKITAYQNELAEQADNGTHEDVFNEEAATGRVKEIIRDGKRLSLIHDPLVRESSFKDDLFDSGRLGAITYADLGLTEEQIIEMDTDRDGFINEPLSEDDQRGIVSRFVTSPDMSGEVDAMLVDYYTKFAKQGWDTKHQEHVNIYNSNNPLPPGGDGTAEKKPNQDYNT